MDDGAFVRSPFGLTASPETAVCWSGRPEVLERLHRLLSSLQRRSDSSLDLMWANLGAGKSHVLYHLACKLRETDGQANRCVPVVVEMPEQIRHFHELYKRIINEMPEDCLANVLVATTNRKIHNDLRQAGHVLKHGGVAEKAIAREWLSGGRPHLAELRRCTGISARIEDDVAACDALAGILTAMSGQKMRLVVLLDEFQRLSVLKPAPRDSLLSNLRTIFSKTPEYLSIILAAAFRIERNALEILSPELRTLLGRRPTISLPEMNETEAVEFVKGRFEFFREAGSGLDPFHPFTESGICDVISKLKAHQRPLIPREILQALAFIYDEARRPDGAIIQPAECEKLMSELQWEDV